MEFHLPGTSASDALAEAAKAGTKRKRDFGSSDGPSSASSTVPDDTRGPFVRCFAGGAITALVVRRDSSNDDAAAGPSFPGARPFSFAAKDGPSSAAAAAAPAPSSASASTSAPTSASASGVTTPELAAGEVPAPPASAYTTGDVYVCGACAWGQLGIGRVQDVVTELVKVPLPPVGVAQAWLWMLGCCRIGS